MFKWIKKLMTEDLTADVAKKNYQKYLNELEQKQQEYKLKLCDDIRRKSLCGYTSVITSHTGGFEDFITREYLANDLKSYFESKGFDTKLVEYIDGDCRLRISWNIDSDSKNS